MLGFFFLNLTSKAQCIFHKNGCLQLMGIILKTQQLPDAAEWCIRYASFSQLWS